MKFSIRTLLLFTLLIASGIAGYRHWEYQKRWSEIRTQLTAWESGLKREPGKIERFYFRSYDDKINRRPLYSVNTAEPFVAGCGIIYFPILDPASRRHSGYFVEPPGIWVGTIDDAIAEFDKLAILRQQMEKYGIDSLMHDVVPEQDEPKENYVVNLFKGVSNQTLQRLNKLKDEGLN